MNVIFMGTPEYAKSVLAALLDDSAVNVVAVYTQPDKPVGRKKILTAPPVKNLAIEYGVDVYQPSKLRDDGVVDQLLQIKCDFIVVAAYGQILPKRVLEHAPCINLHASILPAYRGASPIQHSLLNNDKKSGVTAMLMNEGLDTGDIIKISEVDITPTMSQSSLFDELSRAASILTLDVISFFDSYALVPQDHNMATHCRKISKSDGEVSFDDARELFNRYRAFTPWPGIYLANGLKLKEVVIVDELSSNHSGKILSIESDSIVVGCLRGSVKIYTVQSESKNEMSALAYINGKRLKVEDYLS